MGPYYYKVFSLAEIIYKLKLALQVPHREFGSLSSVYVLLNKNGIGATKQHDDLYY